MLKVKPLLFLQINIAIIIHYGFYSKIKQLFLALFHIMEEIII